MPQAGVPVIGETWLRVRDGDPRAVALFRRHYSCDPRFNHHAGIGGPGERMVLLTPNADALFVWRLRRDGLGNSNGYDDGQRGVMCTVFRNEGVTLSSDLICAAVERAMDKWPHQRLFTYVDGSKVASRNPGYCFEKAGWRRAGKSKRGLILYALEMVERVMCL